MKAQETFNMSSHSPAPDFSVPDRAAINRQNAQHSTGPRTEEGKKKVRMNAVKHGATSKQALLPNESATHFDLLSDHLVRLYDPQTEREREVLYDIRDLTWKQGLDLYSCTECGRCQTHCPTYITGKPLTHKGVNQDLKRWLWHHEEQVSEGRSPDGTAFEPPPLVPNVLSAETIWACTSCGWCETACPVFIENVPRLIEMRRYKVQVEADFPPEAQRVLEGMERQGNPWGKIGRAHV